jgi:fucose permease
MTTSAAGAATTSAGGAVITSLTGSVGVAVGIASAKSACMTAARAVLLVRFITLAGRPMNKHFHEQVLI